MSRVSQLSQDGESNGCTCTFDLPDQTVDSLSRLLYGGLVLESLLITGWTIMYRYIQWSGSTPSYATIVETVIQISVALGLSVMFGVYGAWAKDRGYLIGAAIMQMILLNTVHPFFPDNRLKAFAGVISAIVLGVCWMYFRTEQKIEDENYQRQEFGRRISFGCFDLPDQTAKSLRKWVWFFAVINMAVGAVLIGLGTQVLTDVSLNVVMVGGSLILSSLMGAFGALFENRLVLTFGFIMSLFDVAKINQYLTSLSDEKNSSTGTQASMLQAALVVYYFAIFFAACLCWVNLRIAEKLQVVDVEKMKGAGVLPTTGCCCRRVQATPRYITKLVGVLAVLQLFVAVATVSLAAVTLATPDYIDFNIFFAVVIVVACTSVLYGIWALDKGWLLFYALLNVWVLAFSWRSWQSTATLFASLTVKQPVIAAYIALLTFYWVLAVCGSTLAVFLAETLSDLDNVYLSHRSELTISSVTGDAAHSRTSASWRYSHAYSRMTPHHSKNTVRTSAMSVTSGEHDIALGNSFSSSDDRVLTDH